MNKFMQKQESIRMKILTSPVRTLDKHTLFQEIWDVYHKRLILFIRPMAKEDTEDILQEVMLKVYENLETYNPVYAFSTWIFTIARNHCYNYLKKRCLRTQSLFNNLKEAPAQQSNKNPETRLIAKETEMIIDRALSRMDFQHQQTAYLRFYEGLRIKDIASILDIPPGTVKSRIHFIKSDVRKILEEK